MNVIFVCTGNTCRSPMAEYYLKSKNFNNVNVCSRGFSGGEKANSNSIAVMQEIDIDITGHISASITADDISRADAIVCMTESHKQMLLLSGAAPHKLHVLGGGIPDPFGCDINIYRDCRNKIITAIDALINDDFFCNIKVSSATVDNIQAIANIEKECFSIPWSKNAIKESMTAGTCFYVAQFNDNIVGYMGLSKIAGEGYVTNVAVLPEYRRTGIGKKILEYVIDNSKNELEFISLEVRVSNHAAISLYEKFGFERVGLRKRFYENPQEDAIIMTKYFS
ncbi:MAG: ribosomal-protein-alanine N-acetyltransferase [Ruminococcaceae bacterium]|nr:ribosomal-protein-alanine N-acetyltransferase [Oscillospiraceae bacterium]